jgi:8-oxoguanine deaminase
MPTDTPPALWIRDPLAILADGAERGVVVQDGRIIEKVAAGRAPRTAAATFDAGAHVVLPGLINTHHHFYQTLTRAVPAALDRELFPWLQTLYPLWARLTPEAVDVSSTLAMAELILSGCTLTTDHHYVFPKGVEDAVDIQVAAAKRLGLRVLLTRGSMNRSQAVCRRTAWCRTRTRSSPTASAWWRGITRPEKAPWCRSRLRHARRFRSPHR